MGTHRMAIDIGFGDVKAVFADEAGVRQYKFPTAIRRADVAPTLEGFLADVEYEYQGSRYLVGERAVSDSMSTQSYDFMKRYAPLFAFAAVEKVKSDIREPVIQVAIGFPLGFFDRAVKEIAPLLRTITVSGHTIRMEPLCYPQGYGVLADYRLNEAGSKMPGTDRNLLIVDVGFNTIDICSVEEGRFVKNGTGTLDRRGVAYITDSIRRTLAANYMTTISDQESIEVLRTGHFSHYGQSIDCSDLVNDAVAAYGEWLFNELAAKWEERIRRSDLIILGGGGAYVLKDFIPERYRHMVRVPKDPEYSNARGYLKIMALVVAGRTV